MAISKDTIQAHLSDLKASYENVRAALEQNTKALEQTRGAVWYIENVLLPSYDIDEYKRAEKGDDSPPRDEQAE